MSLAKQLVDTLAALETESARIREGDNQEIQLPKGMPIPTAIRHLEKLYEEESTRVEVQYTFDCWPYEGAFALQQVLKKRFGYAISQAQKIKTFFGTKEICPEVKRVQTGPKTYAQVLWGEFAIPALNGGVFQTNYAKEDNEIKFSLTGSIRQGDRKLVDDIANDLREYLAKNSIYKGKALTVRTDDEGNFTPDHPPSFLDVANCTSDSLILPHETAAIVDALIFGPIRNTDACREYGITLNRGSLLHGDYGTGKTLAAMVAAGHAVRNGWTFFYVDKPKSLLKVMRLARRYQPAVVFVEDVDQFLSDRQGATNEIINEVDGIATKDTEIMCIFTTNHLDKIHPSLLRQGRMDLVLEFPTPDADTVQRLIRRYAGSDLDPKADLAAVGELLKGRIPASIAECVKRAKLVKIASTGNPGIDATSLEIAARSLEAHLQLLDPKQILEPRENAIQNVVSSMEALFSHSASDALLTLTAPHEN